MFRAMLNFYILSIFCFCILISMFRATQYVIDFNWIIIVFISKNLYGIQSKGYTDLDFVKHEHDKILQLTFLLNNFMYRINELIL